MVKKTKITQKEFIIKELLTNLKVTRNYALRNYISRLGALIHTLNEDVLGENSNKTIFSTHKIEVKTSWGNGVGYDYCYSIKEEFIEKFNKMFAYLR